MPRPTDLTPEVQEAICKALVAGNYFETACAYAGVSVTTAYEWRQRGDGRHKTRKGNEVYAEFADAVRKAETDAEVRTVANWQKEVPSNWLAAMKFLERRYPSRWRERKTISLRDIDDPALIALLEEETGGGGEAEGADPAGAEKES